MKDTIRLTDYTMEDVEEIFKIADGLRQGQYRDFLKGKTVILFFPNTSIRTRVTFERGIYLLGGQVILFPQEVLDKKEKIEDVAGYLNNWIDGAIIRHKNIEILEEFAKYSKFPVINAMTDVNHPCEMLADMYALSKIRKDYTKDRYLFLGGRGNIGFAWKEASRLTGFYLRQCCPKGYEIEGVEVVEDIKEAVREIDVICTDSVPEAALKDFAGYQISAEIMKLAAQGAILNPCPPFYRGEEVTGEVIDSEYFLGYHFKKYLLEVQQAILIYDLIHCKDNKIQG